MNIQELTREVRSRIARVGHHEAKHGLMLCYLGAARASEVVGVASGSDTTTPYGPRGDAASEQLYYPGPGDGLGSAPIKAAVFTLRTAKRKGKPRDIALPLDPRYEPWAQPLLNYFQSKGKGLAFPFTRQTLWNYATAAFEGLTYEIDDQTIGGVQVPAHERDAAVHYLRHIRSTELAQTYRFSQDRFLLAYYCGWSYKSAGLSKVMCRYIDGAWQAYFPRLLIGRA